MRVDEHTITLDDAPVYYRSAPGEGVPGLYVHGVPTSSDDWIGWLGRTGGIAPDLIGFGRSAKGGHLDYTPQGLAGFLDRLLDHLDVGRVDLVAHGWGGLAALRLAEGDRVRRLVLISPPAALPGCSWTWFQRAWRRPGIGELLMGSTTRGLLARTLRRASASPQAWPADRVKQVFEQFDQGTQRAILRLHRAWDAEQARALEAALTRLAVPALVLWGDTDPWCRPELARAYANRLPQAQLECIPQAGHWPWLDKPEVMGRASAWLAA